MEKVLRVFESHAAAEQAARADDNGLTFQDRLDAFMQLMVPFYAASPGFQRVYRIDDFRKRTVCDDWGIRLQPLSKPEGNRAWEVWQTFLAAPTPFVNSGTCHTTIGHTTIGHWTLPVA